MERKHFPVGQHFLCETPTGGFPAKENLILQKASLKEGGTVLGARRPSAGHGPGAEAAPSGWALGQSVPYTLTLAREMLSVQALRPFSYRTKSWGAWPGPPTPPSSVASDE